MHKQHPQTAYRKYAGLKDIAFENCDKTIDFMEDTMTYKKLPGLTWDGTIYENEEMGTLEALLPTSVQTR